MAEKRKRTGKRITAFDIMVILLILFLVATVAYRIYMESNNDKVGVASKYIIEFECEDYDSLARYLSAGESVYLSSNGRLLGEIYKSWSDPHAISVEYLETEGESDKEAQSAEDETSVSYKMAKMTGKLKLNTDVTASKEGTYYSLGEVSFSKGSVINVYTDDSEFTITVKNITTVK